MAGTTSGMKAIINGDNTDLVIFRGLTVNKVITWKNSAGSAVDLTGYTAKLQVRESVDSGIITEFSTANNRITINASLGKITLKMLASDTAALPLISGVYDLRLTDAAGAVSQLISGRIRVEDEVTI